jgi:hypothetical protein
VVTVKADAAARGSALGLPGRAVPSERWRPMSSVRFGPLSKPWTLHFEGFSVEPVSEFEEVGAALSGWTNTDGFIYPPQETMYEWDSLTRTRGAPVEGTTRPAGVQRLPATHVLHLPDGLDPEDSRRGVGALVVQGLGLVSRSVIWFEGWGLFGRVPFGKHSPIASYPGEAEDFAAHLVRYRETIGSAEERTAWTNLFYMAGVAQTYEREWEQFIFRYMVLDGLYRRLVNAGVAPDRSPGGHGGRLSWMLEHFGASRDGERETRIVNTRNDMFHEGLWGGAMPGGRAPQRVGIANVDLEGIIERLLVGAVGYSSPFVRAPWTSRSLLGLGLPAPEPVAGP